jgi:hypothetical protein
MSDNKRPVSDLDNVLAEAEEVMSPSGAKGQTEGIEKDGAQNVEMQPLNKKAVRFDADDDDDDKVAVRRGVAKAPPRRMDTLGFSSRRSRAFDDDQSQDEDEAGSGAGGEDDEATAAGQFVNTQGETVANKPNPRFKNYPSVFKDLLKQTNVATMYPICSMIITYDSTKAVTVTKRDDKEYYVKQYDLESYEMTFEEKIGGQPNQYIKLKEVEQAPDGKKYAICYNDDGKFFMRTFGKVTRTA